MLLLKSTILNKIYTTILTSGGGGGNSLIVVASQAVSSTDLLLVLIEAETHLKKALIVALSANDVKNK